MVTRNVLAVAEAEGIVRDAWFQQLRRQKLMVRPLPYRIPE